MKVITPENKNRRRWRNAESCSSALEAPTRMKLVFQTSWGASTALDITVVDADWMEGGRRVDGNEGQSIVNHLIRSEVLRTPSCSIETLSENSRKRDPILRTGPI